MQDVSYENCDSFIPNSLDSSDYIGNEVQIETNRGLGEIPNHSDNEIRNEPRRGERAHLHIIDSNIPIFDHLLMQGDSLIDIVLSYDFSPNLCVRMLPLF